MGAEVGQTSWKLLDLYRTGNHMENPSFTGPSKLLQGLIFFNIRHFVTGSAYWQLFPWMKSVMFWFKFLSNVFL